MANPMSFSWASQHLLVRTLIVASLANGSHDPLVCDPLQESRHVASIIQLGDEVTFFTRELATLQAR